MSNILPFNEFFLIIGSGGFPDDLASTLGPLSLIVCTHARNLVVDSLHELVFFLFACLDQQHVDRNKEDFKLKRGKEL